MVLDERGAFSLVFKKTENLLRALHNGSASAFQAESVGSIPIARFERELSYG